MLVYPKAAPVWVAKPQDSQLEEGKPGFLHCYAQANPEPEVTWFRNSIMITTEVSGDAQRVRREEALILSFAT